MSQLLALFAWSMACFALGVWAGATFNIGNR
jgi:hypothetical protein